MVINAECGKTVRIAYQGENNRQQVRFDLSDIMAEFPGGTAVLAILRSGDTDPVPAAEVELDTNGKALVWTVTAWECAVEGFVYAQVTYAVDQVVAKTRIWRFDVKNSLVVSAAEPETWEDYVGQLVTAAAGVNSAISEAMGTLDEKVTAAETAQSAAEDAQRAAEEAVGQYDDMTATATGLAAGSAPTAEIDHTGSAPVLRLGIPAGERGADGAQGPRGERGPAGPAGDPTELIDDTAGAADKTYSSNKLEQQREELLSAINVLPPVRGKSIAPIYTGDYLADWQYLPSCCIKIGDYFYAFDAPLGSYAEEHQTNVGRIRKFDPINNVEITSFAIDRKIAHANSCACDGTYVYVVPTSDYEAAEPYHPNWIYKFDLSFNAVGTEEIPTVYAQGVTYDPVAEKLYYIDSSRDIYVKENGEWSKVTHVDFSSMPENQFISSRRYNQDIAIYNGRYYIMSPYRNIASGLLTSSVSVPDSGFTVMSTDSSFRYYLGETEGMEFDSDGHLYYMDYSNLIDNSLRNAMIMELPVGETLSNSSPFGRGDGFGYIDGTLNLTEANRSSFRLRTHQLRSLAQLEIRLVRYNSSLIQIPEENDIVEDYIIRINDKIKLQINGKYTCQRFQVLNGRLNLTTDIADDGIPRLVCTSTDAPVGISRVGDLTLAGKNSMRVSTPNRNSTGFWVPDTDYGLAIVRRTPIRHEGGNFTIGGENINSGIYIGTAHVVDSGYMANSNQTKAGSSTLRYISPSMQHESVFWGLSKVAGVNLSSDTSVVVGTYPELSKSAISNMLNSPETISGTNPSIVAKSGIRYVCGEVSTLSITVPSSGIIDVVFTSGTTPTTLTIVPPTGMTMKWANGFDPTSLSANTTYEINIMDGCYGVVCEWT